MTVDPVRFRLSRLCAPSLSPMIGQSMLENLLFSVAMMISTEAPSVHPARAITAAGQIPAAWQPFRDCVVKRESNGNPRAQNPISSAQGKYQFLDNAWRHGAGWNVYKRLRDAGMSRATALPILRELHATPIKRWREAYQDAAFAFAILVPGGWRHWSGGRGCNSLVP